jgi:DNA topoisomerase-1
MAKKASQNGSKKVARSTGGTPGKGGGRAPARSGGRGKAGAGGRRQRQFTGDATGKHLVIVESPTKAKTINKYLGNDYVVMASVGHVRDLPKSPPKGAKRKDHPVPGVDLDHDFEPTYEVLPDKKRTITDLKKVAKQAADVWFATDLDREGEAIAWHLAETLGVPLDSAKRVVFNAITKAEIGRAFDHPRSIDTSKVDAQQARRILDRIVGYQVSPLLWKKVAGGLSAGRVQSVATRLVVEREREIEAFIPDEYWRITGLFSTDLAKTQELGKAWRAFIKGGGASDDNAGGNGGSSGGGSRTAKEQNAWLGERKVIRAELAEVDGREFKPTNRDEALAVAQKLGFECRDTRQWQDDAAKGPQKFLCRYEGEVRGDAPAYRIASLTTKRTTVRPPGPFITSTMQQAASNRLGFQLQRCMRVAQQLYEGIDLGGARGQTGLITYMRTDSTHLSGEALQMARDYIGGKFGGKYLPDKPNFFTSSNKSAQEAHEAIRPTDVTIHPDDIRGKLTDEQYKLYRLIWQRFVACQMSHAEWDSTTAMIQTQAGGATASFKATGRTLVFDGFYRVAGVPGGDELILPPLQENQPLGPMQLDPTQHFTSPPPRYTEASLQKKLEEEGIGRPSTYAAIIGTIQDRKYVETVAPGDRRLMATDLGKVVTDLLQAAFPGIMDVGYTRAMEDELDKIESDRHDWRKMLHEFYGPFKEKLDNAFETVQHAKAVMEPAPHKCTKCGAATVYRFGRKGRFLSCARYPDCDYAAPIDKKGNPMEPELSDIVCPTCGSGMNKRTGRFGPFLGCVEYPTCKGIVKLDPKKGTVVPPKTPPLVTDLPCPKCDAPLNLRMSKRGPWLSCSRFPKCRGRLGWTTVEEPKQQELEKAWAEHDKANPVPVIRNTEGRVVDETYIPRVAGGDASSEESVAGYTLDAA